MQPPEILHVRIVEKEYSPEETENSRFMLSCDRIYVQEREAYVPVDKKVWPVSRYIFFSEDRRLVMRKPRF
jgi:hypothetical protein